MTDAAARVYYKTEGLIYEDKYLREAWRSETGEARDGKAYLPIPEEAALFYFSVEGNAGGQTLHDTTGVYTRVTWQTA